jgi:hypothetical protein
MVSAMVWTGIPLLVTIFTIYGFWRKKHKYFYPFLIITVMLCYFVKWEFRLCN